TSTSDASATTNETSETGVDSGPKFDVGEMGDIGVDECQAKCGNTDWSYVWIANSAENTISKIDTRDVIEVGRYYTRPDTQGNPSRTSVSIDAKAVAVANRSGGITKIWARDEYCDDKNNNGVIDTSTGANDVRPFDQEECIAWHTPFPATTQRPIAWTSGVYNEETCEYDDQKIWTAAGLGSGGTWPCDGTDGIYVYLLDGETGAVEEEIHMPEVDCGGTFGPYGAAVDFKNDVWIYIWSAGKIVHVEFDTLNYEVINGGSYGITVDTLGRVWVGDYPRRYDPQQGIWEQPNNNLPGAGGAGIAEDLQGRMWTATQGGVGWVDRDSLVVGDTVPLPEGNGIYRGIGVDVDGYIWAVYLGGTTAHRIDPDTYEISTYTGLNSPYTYSDMAGGQINNVVCNPPNG
ncbi:MAG: hypothetical protein KC468_19885, partial [Myxococcales bacterium]|nr:hypothetical protein [Myxococcales bacterium]